MLGSVVADARVALAGISAEHPVLRAAHVLDAGACALLVVLDALARVVGGEPAGRRRRWPGCRRRRPTRGRWNPPAARSR